MNQAEPKTILIVDDEEALRFFVGHALAQNGWQVAEADSGEAALSLLQQQPPDVLLLDLRMAGMDGLDLLRLMGEALSATAVIIMTAYASVDSAVTAIQYRVFDYLRKPCDTQQVVEAVERAWAEKERRRQMAVPPAAAVVPASHAVRTGDLTIDLQARAVLKQGQPISLTPTEYEIIACLAENIGAPVTLGRLIVTVLNFDPLDYQAQETLRVHVSRLRGKIGASYIRTVRGGKYALAYIQAV